MRSSGGEPGRAGLWLCAIVLVGAALRFFPIWFGLPYWRARPDEETAVGLALGVLKGELNPHFFHWPSLIFYVFAALFAVASGVRRILSLDPAMTVAGYTILARGFVALAGTLTIVVLFRLGRRVADTTTGLIAALFLAVAILHVRDSHFAMTDVLTTLLVTVSIALLLRAVDRTSDSLPSAAAGPRWFAAAGLAGGLAASTKYSAAAVIAAMAAAQLTMLKRPLTLGVWTPSAAYLLAFSAGFLLATPYAVLDFEAFESGLRYNVSHLSSGHGVNLGRGWSYHLTRSLPYGVGIPTFVAALAGIVPFVRHHRRQALIIGAFAAALYGSLAGGQTVFFRYVLPLVPFVCLAAAVAVLHTAPWVASRSGLSKGVAAGVIAGAIAAPSLVNSAWFDVLLAKTDTRVLAVRWLEERLQPEMSLHDAAREYSRLDLRHVEFHRWYFDPVANTFGHPEGRTPDWLVFHDSPLRAYAGAPFPLRQLAREKYVLVQRFTATRGRARAAVYDQQDAFFMPFSRFGTVERPGPTISIYRRVGP